MPTSGRVMTLTTATSSGPAYSLTQERGVSIANLTLGQSEQRRHVIARGPGIAVPTVARLPRAAVQAAAAWPNPMSGST